jgi:hypothetical protein
VLHTVRCSRIRVDTATRMVQCGTASTLTVSEVSGPRTCPLSRDVRTYTVYSGRKKRSDETGSTSYVMLKWPLRLCGHVREEGQVR